MASAEVTLASELNKFNKNQLIDMLIYQKLPTNTNYSDRVKDLIKKISDNSAKSANDSFDDALDSVTDINGGDECNKIQCIRCKYKCEYSEMKVETLTKMVSQLEDKILIQKDLIVEIKRNINGLVVHTSASTTPLNYANKQSSADNVKNAGQKTFCITNNTSRNIIENCEVSDTQTNRTTFANKIKSKKVAQSSSTPAGTSGKTKATANTDKKNDFTGIKQNVLKKFNSSKSMIKGSSKSVSKLNVVEKTSWIFISGLSPETTCANITGHLDDLIKADYKCEKLETKNMEHVASFKVRIPAKYKMDIMKEDQWPEGIILNNFFQKRVL